MTLPNFPIRTRLIPYDDLGIQEVSPNLLSLQNDVDIVLAALMAMGKNGSQMLQVSNNSNLLTASSGTSSYADVGEHIIFGDYHLVAPNPIIADIDLSHHLNYIFLVDVTNYDDVGTNASIELFLLDSLGNEYFVVSVLSFNDNINTFNYLGMLHDLIIFSDRVRLRLNNIADGKSCDLHLEAYAI